MDAELKAALNAIDRQDYTEALRLLRPLAEAGNAKAQNNLGTLYQLGLGIKLDLNEAITWFKKAVDQGEGSAAHNLGTIYITGLPGIPFNEDESKKWYRKARELGFEVADQKWYE